jgi:hypothetical protein
VELMGKDQNSLKAKKSKGDAITFAATESKT